MPETRQVDDPHGITQFQMPDLAPTTVQNRPGPGTETDNDDDPDPRDAEMAALREKLANLEGQIAGVGRAQTRPVVNLPPPPPQVSFDDLPDPVSEGDKFRSELGKRVTQAIETGVQTGRQITSRETLVANAWNRFQTKYPELAKHQAVVRAVANEVSSEYMAQGKDFFHELSQNAETYVDAVAKKMESTVSALKGGEPAETARTTTLPSGKKGGKGKSADTEPKGFVDQLRDIQRSSGFF